MEKVLVCNKAFNLNMPEGMTRYRVGDKVTGAHADHWYAKAHCSESQAEAEKDAARDPIKDALATKALVNSLVTAEKPVPTMDAINKALREANLPQIKAAERDAMLPAPAPAAPVEGGEADATA